MAPHLLTPRAVGRGGLAAGLAALLAAGVGTAVAQPTAAAVPGGAGSALAPVDPADWVDQDDMTWEDYTAVPGAPAGWADGTATGSVREFRAAVVLLDFTDQPLLVTQPPGSHPFGSPAEDFEPVAPEDAPQWWEDYLNTPTEANHGHTITEYWMENSNGRYSVDVDAFGTYTLPGKLHEYGLAGHAPVTGPDSVCPAGDDCTKDIRTDGFAAWYADQGDDVHEDYDVLFWVTAGHDESGTWQKFGDMQFATPEDVPAELGPPGATEGPVYNDAGNEIPSWAPTRYVPWTSWRSAATHWPNATSRGVIPNSTQAESSGQAVFQHEMSHLLGIGDNYNNPFGDPPIRSYTGPWDMLSRGSFNGPGGTHLRWQVPNAGGASMGSHFTLRNKQRLELVSPEQVLGLSRSGLAADGVARATVQARSVNREGDLAGLTVVLDDDGLGAGDRSSCEAEGYVGEDAWRCDRGGYEGYSVEVVDRMGTDSFTPSSGVHVAKTKPVDRAPFVWTVDANPQDIGLTDFVRPDGTPVPVTVGDQRQLNDAMFRAGTRSGSQDEHVDEANGLHVYVLDRQRDADGVLSYDVAVRSLEGSGDQARGAALDLAGATAVPVDGGAAAELRVPMTNTGGAGVGASDGDVYRLSSAVDGGWEAVQPYDLLGATAGETVDVPLQLVRGPGGLGTATVTVTSESDPGATATAEVAVHPLLAAYAQELVADLDDEGALGSGVEARLASALATAARSTERGLAAQAERSLDRAEALASRVTDEAARADLLAAVEVLRVG